MPNFVTAAKPGYWVGSTVFVCVFYSKPKGIFQMFHNTFKLSFFLEYAKYHV